METYRMNNNFIEILFPMKQSIRFTFYKKSADSTGTVLCIKNNKLTFLCLVSKYFFQSIFFTNLVAT